MSKLIAQTLPEADKLTVDPMHYYRQVLHGYYNFNCYVSEGVTRTAKFYIPEGSVYNQPTIFLAVPAARPTDEFLVDSGWKDLADQMGFYIILMEAENGAWGDDAKEIPYITALNEDVNFRPFFCAFSSKFYVYAYGETAGMVGRQSRLFPKCWAGVALLGPSGMTADELHELQTKETRVPGVKYSDVQMPVWLSAPVQDDDFNRQLAYYQAANHSVDTPEEVDGHKLWAPKAGGTIDEHWCSAVVTDTADWEMCLSAGYSRTIWQTVFCGVARFPGNANGALRRNEPIEARGFQSFTAPVAGGYYEDGHDVYQRQWYVYQPETVDPAKPSPLVFVFHGAGGISDEIADRTGWGELAKKYGFTILCPMASVPNRVRHVTNMVTNEMFRAMWNTGAPQPDRPADLLFVDYLYDWVTSHYNIDKSRVYASGQSSGGMMSWACASYRPDLFAATAPVSAKTPNIETEPLPVVDGSIIPVMSNLGLLDGMFKGGFGTPDARMLIERWHDAFHLAENWDSYTYDDGGKNCSFQNGLFTNYIYRNSQGVPILRCVEAATKTHAVWPSECEMAWTEFMRDFSKDPDTKELYYKGEKVVLD